jgi:hypothetical protein
MFSTASRRFSMNRRSHPTRLLGAPAFAGKLGATAGTVTQRKPPFEQRVAGASQP